MAKTKQENRVKWSEVTNCAQGFAIDPQVEPCCEKIVLTIEVYGIHKMPIQQIRRASKEAINKYFKNNIHGF